MCTDISNIYNQRCKHQHCDTTAAHHHNVQVLLCNHNLLKGLDVTRGEILHFSTNLHFCS